MTVEWGRRLLLVALVLAMVLSYQAVLDAPFVYDDKIEVVGNGTIRDLDEWRAIARYNLSRPLLVLTYAVDFHRHALEPRGYHLTNLAVAGLAIAAALFLAEGLLRLWRVGHPLPRAAAAVGVWVLHPMATEGITYITGRSESLCAVFCFFAVGAWAQALLAEGEGRSGSGWRALGLLGFAGAVTTKEVGAMTPAALLAVELLGAGRGGGAASPAGRLRAVRWAWFLPLAALVLLAGWLRLQHAPTFLPREVDRPLPTQLVTQAEAWRHYLRLWLLPWGQTIFHHLDDVAPASLRGGAAVGGWALLVAGAVAWARRVPVAGAALACAALFLLPSSSLVPLKENMAEHRAFQTGLWLAIALVGSLPARALRPAAWALVPVLGVLVGLTQLRHRAWQSEVALWEEAVARRPEVAAAWYGLGDARRFASDYPGAEQAYLAAVERDPEHLDAWNNLGITRASLGDAAGATEAWNLALRKSPTYCKAHANLGVLAAGERDWDRALGEFRTTLAYCPDNPRAHLGLCELHRGPRRDREKAIFHCQAFVDLSPTSDQALRVKEWLLELTF